MYHLPFHPSRIGRALWPGAPGGALKLPWKTTSSSLSLISATPGEQLEESSQLNPPFLLKSYCLIASDFWVISGFFSQIIHLFGVEMTKKTWASWLSGHVLPAELGVCGTAVSGVLCSLSSTFLKSCCKDPKVQNPQLSTPQKKNSKHVGMYTFLELDFDS